MKFLRIVLKGLAGLVALIVFLYVVGVAVNWRDQAPSADALRMRDVLVNRPSVSDSQNAFIYAMGFAALESADPQAVGARRVAWLEQINRDSTRSDADPVPPRVDFKATASDLMNAMRSACADSHGVECRDAFEAAAADPVRNAAENLQLARYRELLERSAWREVVPLDVRAPIALFSNVMGGQRLLLVELRRRASLADVEGIGRALGEDIRFWREVLKSSDFMISKMIAVAALRQHFYFGNLVLRQLPGDRALAATPDEWRIEFTREELSMLRTMAGELVFARYAMNEWKNATAWQATQDEIGARSTISAGLAAWLARPYYQPQDQTNFYATQYLEFAGKFDVPLAQYDAVVHEMRNASAPGFSLHVYNLTGEIFRGIASTQDYAMYPLRVGSVEAMRRAALLTTQLRGRSVTTRDMPAELKNAVLRNPFDGEPFAWSVDEDAVVHEAQETDPRRRNVYFY